MRHHDNMQGNVIVQLFSQSFTDSPEFCENIDKPRENPKCHLILTDGKNNALYKAW